MMPSPDFRSDNTSPVSPAIIDALNHHLRQAHDPYGEDRLTDELRRRVGDLFAHDVHIVPVITGTAGNALALSMVARSFGTIVCHREAHIVVDENGAIEFLCRGARLLPVAGAQGKITAKAIAGLAEEESVHRLRPGAVSVSQSTEFGTVYEPAELAELSAVARSWGVPLHMDGTRFANAVATGRSAEAMTWKAGVDVLCFGATKGGAPGAEMIVFFDRHLAADVERQAKRTGHLLSRSWFLAAQLLAFLDDGLWLKNAAAANASAASLATVLTDAGAEIVYPVQTNIVFARLDQGQVAQLAARGIRFYQWDRASRPLVRFVTSFATTPQDIEGVRDALSER